MAQKPEIGEDAVQTPKKYLVDDLETLINGVFPRIHEGYADKYFISRCAILTPINDNVDKINAINNEQISRGGKDIPVC